MFRYFFSVFICLTSICTAAQTRVDTSKPISFKYMSKAWNKNPTAIDSGSFVLRDSASKKIVTIQLLETGESTGEFIGQYNISWGEAQITPEIYVLPKSLAASKDQKKIDNLINEGLLLRKPFFFRADPKSAQELEIFDTKEQATAALDAYRKSHLAVLPPTSSLSSAATPVGRPALEAQAAANALEEKTRQSEAAAQLLSERQKMEAQEKLRQAKLRQEQEAMAAQEIAQRKEQSRKLGEKGLELYKDKIFIEAEKAFSQASDLDPQNETFYYQYGVTLYKNEKYNRSLVILTISKATEANSLEREYYMGLNYMKLKELDAAIAKFQTVKSKDDKVLSPSAAFFAGVANYQKENFDEAKSNFEYVLDHSQDPNLDSQSETYLEQIANIAAFKREQSRKYFVNLNIGLMYDSNILAISNSQASQQTELAGFRWSYGGSVEYRPIYTVNHEFSGVLSLSDMYSTDKKFKAAANFQSTDPWLLTVYFPYRYKGSALGKAYQMTLSPGYETTRMDVNQTGTRKVIVNSTVLKTDHTFVMKEDWFATYTGEIRRDMSLLDSSGDDDQTATKISLGSLQTFFQDQKKTQAWVGEVGLSQNAAAGRNSTYNRFDLAATYFAPWKWDTTWTARLGFYNANYNQHAVGRVDNDSSLALGLRKPLNLNWAATLTGVYTINSSTLASSDYSKYLIMSGFSWTASP